MNNSGIKVNSSKDLTDEERRQKAADLLMKLVSNCPELQDGDDDEEGNEENTIEA